VIFEKDNLRRKDEECWRLEIGGWKLTERNKTRTIVVDLVSVGWATSRVWSTRFFQQEI
jgi:hypothetical protein